MASFWTLIFALCCLPFDLVLSNPLPGVKGSWKSKERQRAKAKEALGLSSRAQESICTTRDAIVSSAPLKNIWAGLTGPETASVLKWLFHQKDLNLTKAADAGEWDNSVYVQELAKVVRVIY